VIVPGIGAKDEVRRRLWERDVREFGVSVERERGSETRVTLMECLSVTAPSIARVHCCYICTVIFYVWPWVIETRGRNKGGFLRYEEVDSLLAWGTIFVFDGEEYSCGGGRVVRHCGHWWMRHWASRRRETVRDDRLPHRQDACATGEGLA